MKEMDLLRAMNDIDEEYIEEAAPAEKKELPLFVRYRKQFLSAGLSALFLIGAAFLLHNSSMYKMGGSASSAAEAAPETAAGGVIMDDAAEEESVNAAFAPNEAAEDRKGADAGMPEMTEAVSSLAYGTVPDVFGRFSLDYPEPFEFPEEGVVTVTYTDENGKTGLILTRIAAEGECEMDMIFEDTLKIENGKIMYAEWEKACVHFTAEFAEGTDREELEKLISQVY